MKQMFMMLASCTALGGCMATISPAVDEPTVYVAEPVHAVVAPTTEVHLVAFNPPPRRPRVIVPRPPRVGPVTPLRPHRVGPVTPLRPHRVGPVTPPRPHRTGPSVPSQPNTVVSPKSHAPHSGGNTKPQARVTPNAPRQKR